MEDLPFELWCVNDVSNPDDDYQCLPWINDLDSNKVFNIQNIDHAASSASNDPFTDGFYWLEPIDQTQAGYENMLALHESNPQDASDAVLWAYRTPSYGGFDWGAVAGMMRMTFVNWNGGDVSGGTYNADMPEPGTIFRIVTAKPNTLADVFSVTAPDVMVSDALAKEAVEKINVFPNPYYAYNSQEKSRFNRFVTFHHMPQKATVRIFTLSGVQVVKLEKDSDSQFLEWNLRNASNLPVASGLYIAHIDMPDLGKEKVLKLFIVQGAEILEYY